MRAHQCADRVAIRLRSGEFQPNEMMPEFLVVSQHERFAASLREHDIEITVAIEIAYAPPRPTIGGEMRPAVSVGTASKPARFLPAIPEKLRGLRIGLAQLHLVDFLFEVAIELSRSGQPSRS